MINNIKEIRLRSGLTQKELAEKTGLKQNRISNIEKMDNIDNLTISVAYKLCNALEITLDELVNS